MVLTIGVGGQFTTFEAALAAAQPGDTLELLEGSAFTSQAVTVRAHTPAAPPVPKAVALEVTLGGETILLPCTPGVVLQVRVVED